MAIEQYPNLPGTRVTLRDGGLRVGKTTADALPKDNILFIGTAVDGPKDTPVLVSSPDRAIEIFGAYTNSKGEPNGATLVPAFLQAWDAGARKIYLMRVTGEYASLELKDGDDTTLLIVRGRYPGARYNAIEVSVNDQEILIDGFEVRSYALTNEDGESKTLGQLIAEINRDSATHGAVAVLPDGVDENTTVDNLAVVTGAKLQGGTNGLNPVLGSYGATGYRGDLERAYKLLEGQSFDIIVPLGVRVNWNGTTLDTTDAHRLAEFCAQQTLTDNPAIGVINVSQPADYSLATVKEYAEGLAGTDHLYSDTEGNDLGRYLQVVVGRLIFNDDLLGTYSDDAAAAYAGLLASLERHRSTTNKVVRGALGVAYQLTAAQRDALAANGFVTIYNQVGRGPVVTSDRTAAPLGSDYDYMVTVRIATDVVKAIRLVGNAYIGEPMSMARQNALKGDIDAVLAARKDTAWGAILDYSFQLTGSLIEQIRGIFTVEVNLVPVPTLRRLRIVISLRAGLENA